MRFAVAAAFLSLLLASISYAQETSTSVKSEGACSPNIVENKGQIQFTCNRVLDAKAATKIVAILNEVLKRQGDPAAVSDKLDEILAFVRNQSERSAREDLEKRLAEDRRRTAPVFDVALVPISPGKVKLNILSENLIPFEYRYVIVTSNNEIVSGIMLENGKVYPSTANKLFYETVDLQQEKIRDSYLELRFRFQSLSADELNLPGHRGQVIRKYRVDPKTWNLSTVE